MLLAFVLDALRRAIGCAHPDRGEAGLELSLRAGAPGDGLPLGTGQHVLGCDRQDIGNRALTRTPAPGDGEDQLHTDRVYLEVTGDADSPDQVATRQLLAERRALPIASIGQHTAKASTACDQAINFGKRDLRLRACAPMWDRNAGPLQTCRIIDPALRQEETQGHRYWHFAARKGHRHQRLAIGGLAKRRRILRSNADRVLTLLR